MHLGLRNYILLNGVRYAVLSLGGGGLGLRRFSLLNQAMLAKQYWRLCHNPNSLIARTFKAKYYPRGSIHTCSPKPH